MINIALIIIGQLVSWISKISGRGNGSTWPGHIALSINPHFIEDITRKSKTKIIIVAGTNGKTTTGSLITTILDKNGKKVFQNDSGANLTNGIASSFLLNTNFSGKITHDFAVFEVDENHLPILLIHLTPDYLVLLNLFRDQLDRYGEVDTIAKKWHEAIDKLPEKTTLILNADDPAIAYLGQKRENVYYFGIDDKKIATTRRQHASDSLFCPNCGKSLIFSRVYFSHLGDWECSSCEFKHPKLSLSSFTHYPLPGVYNRYNTLAAVLTVQQVGVTKQEIESSLVDFQPVFGRQEIIEIDGKKIQLFLSKNPTSFNQSLATIMSLKPKHLLFVLNDRVPDGHDISWIWDTDIENYTFDDISIYTSGDRAYDMSLRLKYAYPAVKLHTTATDLKELLPNLIKSIPTTETLFILPTYSAMLEVRNELVGKKIL